MRKLIGSLLQVVFVAASRAMVSVATLVSVPIIITQAGIDFWVSAAVGQVVGEIGRSICVWGYGGRIAYLSSLPELSRLSFFRVSFWGRSLVSAVTIPLLLLVVAALTETHRDVALWMTLAGSLNGLGASWYFVATGQSRLLIALDAAPRAIGIVAGALALYALPDDAQGWGMGGMVALGSLFSVVIPTILILRSARTNGVQRAVVGEIRHSLVAGIPALVYSLCMTVRLSLPLTITAGISSGNTAAVALADKFVRWGNTGTSPLAEVIQAKVKDSGSSTVSRVRKTVLLSGCVGLVLAGTITILVPRLSTLVSVGEVTLGFGESSAIAVCISGAFMSSVTSLALVPLIGRKRVTAWASMTSLLVVAILVYPLTTWFGPSGALWSLAFGEFIVLSLTCAEIARGLRFQKLSSRDDLPREVRSK